MVDWDTVSRPTGNLPLGVFYGGWGHHVPTHRKPLPGGGFLWAIALVSPPRLSFPSSLINKCSGVLVESGSSHRETTHPKVAPRVHLGVAQVAITFINVSLTRPISTHENWLTTK
jgi:hypothetical protein